MSEDQRPEQPFKPSLKPSDLQASTEITDFSGEFDINEVNRLIAEASSAETASEMFTVLADAATQQGFGDLADSLTKRAQATPDTLSSDPDLTVMAKIGSQQAPRVQGTAEQIIKRDISSAISYLLIELRKSSEKPDYTDLATLADVRLNVADDMRIFVALCQILAKNPTDIETTQAAVELYGPDDETGQRHDVQTVPSTVGGYDLVLWRHAPGGRTTRTNEDMVKIFLQKRESQDT